MPRNTIAKHLSVFSAMGYTGLGIGMMLKSVAPERVDALLMALVCGTFLYISLTEVVPSEFEDGSGRWKKFFSFVAGIGTVRGVGTVAEGLHRN